MMLYQTDIACAGIELTPLVMVGTDSIGSGKSNYNAITTTTTPILLFIAINVLHATAALSLLSITTGQTKDCKIGICLFSAKHAALREKSKNWLDRNQDNVSEWSDMSIRGLLFQ
jgi:hypothetical protein